MANPYIRVSVQGGLPGGEVWSVNPAFQGDFSDATPTHTQLQAWATALVTADVSLYGTWLRSCLSSKGTITGYRVAFYGTDGLLDDYATGALATPLTGSDQLALPPTTAVALSLYSATQTRRGRGRLFWPALGAPIDTTTGRIQSTATAGLATDTVAMLAAIEAAGPSAFAPIAAIWSQTAGTTHPVTSVRVGNVPDSQRGRKSALTEAYSIASFPS